MKRFLFALVFVALAEPAVAQVYIDGSDIEDVVNAAKGFGSAFLEHDDDVPMLSGRIGGRKYYAYFHDCASSTACDNFILQAYWNGHATTADFVNSWNFDERWTKLYLSEDDGVVLEMDVDLAGGVSLRVLERAFSIWSDALGRIDNFMLGAPDTEAIGDGGQDDMSGDEDRSAPPETTEIGDDAPDAGSDETPEASSGDVPTTIDMQ